jgi:hypothetical protein
MTNTIPNLQADLRAGPSVSTLVLLNRAINPKHHAERFSTFGDEIWDLGPAIFEAHDPGLTINFADVPSSFKLAAKWLCWLQLNHTEAQGLLRAGASRPSVRSVALGLSRLKPFLRWLDTVDVASLKDVRQRTYSEYLVHLIDEPLSQKDRRDRIAAVQRLWSYRNLMPLSLRLPAELPWDGIELPSFADPNSDRQENRTQRIPEATMSSLLLWAIRMVEDFGQDIVTAFRVYRHLCNRNESGRRAGRHATAHRHLGGLHSELLNLLDGFRDRGIPLPGRYGSDGAIVVSLSHIARLLNCSVKNLNRYKSLINDTGLELGITNGEPLEAPITGMLEGAPWRDRPIAYHEAPILARLLSTACFVVISYLSGMRPGEAITLRRGCATHDDVTGLDFIRGWKWKGSVEPDGSKRAEGEERELPWTVVPIVVQAVLLLERLHSDDLLFPTTLHINGRLSVANLGARTEKARILAQISKDIESLIRWVESYCALHERTDVVVADPTGKDISPSRFRRTLAWFIWHRPRGAVAAALQYGHVHVRITQGYAGTYDSGFPDEYAFEDFLGRLQTIYDDDQHLKAGEHISGPAAEVYQNRISTGAAYFRGRVFSSVRQARAALSNPALQVYHGDAVTCVLDPAKALCRLRDPDDDVRRTPDLDNCRAECSNIARTDRDVEKLRIRYHARVIESENTLAPEPRRVRARQQAELLLARIETHEAAITSIKSSVASDKDVVE